MNSADIEELVEALASSLDRALSLEDLGGILLAYSRDQPLADRVRVNFLLSKQVPADVSVWQLQHGRGDAVLQLPDADVRRDLFAQQEVHPDPVGERLVAAVGEQYPAQVFERQRAVQAAGESLDQLFDIRAVHGLMLRPGRAPKRTRGDDWRPTGRHLSSAGRVAPQRGRGCRRSGANGAPLAPATPRI